MVWLVQNCRSNKCLQFLNPPELRGGFNPPGPPTRALSWNRCGTLSGPQTPLLLTPPLIPNPGPAPVDTNNPQGMQLGRSKNRIENKFVNRKLEKKGGVGVVVSPCHERLLVSI